MTVVLGMWLAHSESIGSQMGTPREEISTLDIPCGHFGCSLRLLVDLPLGAVTCFLGGCKYGRESPGAPWSCFMTPLGGSVVVVRQRSFWHCARSVSEAC